ncbi:MAG: methyltransferase domain-containing protein [Candidatus Eisenbacteria bacterium]|nr:methyltransferase domain-containing protein [Candidatus Eisenbacteria bacterium]
MTTASPSPRALDWNVGCYELTAVQLMPAARVVVDRARLMPGEHVLDVGCGSGNAALLAAERGARVTGVDPAIRLLEVARAQAAVRGLDARFLEGEAASLPLEDGTADVVMSVFGVIFAPDACAATAEMARVAGPRGRILLTAWLPGGPVCEAALAAHETTTRVLGSPQGPAPFAWHERESLKSVFGPLGWAVTLEEHSLAFTAASARKYLDAEFQHHPLWRAACEVLEPRGELETFHRRLVAILEKGNEDPSAFRGTSRYVVAVCRRAPTGSSGG